MSKWLSLLFLFFFHLTSNEKFPVELTSSHLIFENDQWKTTQGALIQTEGIRIQAQNVVYTKKMDGDHFIHTVAASGDLMIVYGKRIFLADSVFFDFQSKEGVMLNGLTYDNLWFISGKTVSLCPDGSLVLKEGILTTSEYPKPEFSLNATEVTLKPQESLKAKHLSIRYANVPIFYIPYFYTSLDQNDDSKIRYQLTWDSGQGPKFSFRYQVYDTPDFDTFLRFDFRINRGLAGAIETDYHHPTRRFNFKTKNYLAHDTFFNDTDPNQKKTRYRLQGVLHAETLNADWKSFLRYDKYSDPNMPLDFNGDNFELNTNLKTEWIIWGFHPMVRTNFYLRPKINSFQGFKQELPSLKFTFKPLEIGSTGAIFANQIQLAFLNYEYNKSLDQSLPSFQSGRFDLNESIAKSIDLSILTVTPYVNYHGIYYTQTPNQGDALENLLNYGVCIESILMKSTPHFSHLFTPFFEFKSIHPLTLKDHYIFSYEDGYDPYQLIRLGAKNSFEFLNTSIDFHFFFNRFFNQKTFTSLFPKLNLTLDIESERFLFYSNFIYNFDQNNFDQANGGLRYAMNAYIAFKLELYYRSRYGYRKVNYDDYTLDIRQNTEDLLISPISDSRKAITFSTQFNPTPSMQIRYESHLGFGRKSQPFYHEFNFDIFKMIATNWKLRLSYQHLVNDDQVAFGLTLVPNP